MGSHSDRVQIVFEIVCENVWVTLGSLTYEEQGLAAALCNKADMAESMAKTFTGWGLPTALTLSVTAPTRVGRTQDMDWTFTLCALPCLEEAWGGWQQEGHRGQG